MGSAAGCVRASTIEEGAIGGRDAGEPLFIRRNLGPEGTRAVKQGATAGDLSFNKPTRLVVPRRNTYKKDPKYRIMLRNVVTSVLVECGLMKTLYRVEEDKLFSDIEIENMKKIIYAEVYVSISHWKAFLRRYCHYSEKGYITIMFLVLWHIHNRRERRMLDNLLSGISFVVLSTAYFCHNGMDSVLKHPIRILATFFETSETRLRMDFGTNGYNRLAEHCSNNKMLWVYDQIHLDTDRRSEEKYRCLCNRAEKACKALITSFDSWEFCRFTVAVLIVNSGKYDGKAYRMRIVLRKKNELGNKLLFQDHHFPPSIIQSIEKEDCGARKRDKPQAEVKKSSFRPPLVDDELVEKIESSLSEVNSWLCELDKMTELLLE